MIREIVRLLINEIMFIEKVTRKSMLIRPSGRSTDFISPSFGHGCLYNCSYCYMKRHKPEGLSVATNTMDILTEINSHAWFADVEKPNQTGDLITYDISCNEDFALHAKYHEWEKIFEFFRDHPLAMGSFATKFVNNDLLKFNAEGKIRIRFSLMPEKIRQILEPNTSTIEERLRAVTNFYIAGYNVHVNFSPVVVYDNWLDDYKDLFEGINWYAATLDDGKPENIAWQRCKAEVIFLTHNEDKHLYNLANNLPGEDLLWVPKIQEQKTSQYGGKNIRYEHNRKADYIKQFVELHDEIIPWNTIRYIF
jgi:spore photoproduct lyase